MRNTFILQSALRSLAKNKIRSTLTVLGISIGITAVIVVMSAGQSLRAFVGGQIDIFGPNLI
ncbi:MAG: ABC transporter permease, partial [Patescibacteria group bacterium]